MLISADIANPAKTWCLQEINALPLRLDGDLYSHYPGMKLGSFKDLVFFGDKLSALATSILNQESNTSAKDWIVSAPAFYYLPSAANLLARRVHNLLRKQGYGIHLHEPRLSQEQNAVNSMEAFKKANDYSKSQVQQRQSERQRIYDLAKSNVQMQALKGQRLLVINDIYVTGTQQAFMQKMLDQLEVKDIHWLYIFHVEKHLAQLHPEIEFQINNHLVGNAENFAAIMNDEHTVHTTRCLSRLFSEDIQNFQHVINLLRPDTIKKIIQLAKLEDRYTAAIFAEKLSILAAAQASKSLSIAT